MFLVGSFFLFAAFLITTCIFVIFSKNPVNSVLFLVLAFLNSTFLFILIGAEFLGMMMIIVYVGAVAVLFLFVVMLLNVSEQKLSWFRGSRKTKHIPIGLAVGAVILLELIVVVGGWKYRDTFSETKFLNFEKDFTNTHAIGNVMYTEYIHLFQISGLILLLSMIGAIVLTYRKREGVKRQNYFTQVGREREDSIKLVEVESGKGINLDD